MQTHLVQHTKSTVQSLPAVQSHNTNAIHGKTPKNDEVPFADIVELLAAQSEKPADFEILIPEQESPKADDLNTSDTAHDGETSNRWRATDEMDPSVSARKTPTEDIANLDTSFVKQEIEPSTGQLNAGLGDHPEPNGALSTSIETDGTPISPTLEKPTHEPVRTTTKTPVEILMMSQHQPRQSQQITLEISTAPSAIQKEVAQLMPVLIGSQIDSETPNILPSTDLNRHSDPINPIPTTQTNLAGILIPRTQSPLGEPTITAEHVQLRTQPQNVEEPNALQEPLEPQRTPPLSQSTATQPTTPPAQIVTTKLITEPPLEQARDDNGFRLEATLETKLTAHPTTPAPPNRTDNATPIARQVIDAIHARVTTEKVIEVSLNPAELGRLKLSLTPAENGLVINVLAERTEAIELMRRNLSELKQEFSELGHENITFSFEQSNNFAEHDHSENSEPSTDESDLPAKISTSPTIEKIQSRDLSVTSGIDIRI